MPDAAGTPYVVVEYLGGCMPSLLSSHRSANKDAISAKQHIQYFEEYFRYVGAKTVVIESEYVDHDYLEDFAAYYVRCFELYDRLTTRLHFFRSRFTEIDFAAVIAGNAAGIDVDGLKESYLGFIVVKPLPQTVVGRTCLKTYDDDPTRRFFPSIRTYDVGLFGIQLRVEALGFQEQDQIAAACATSALWSIFQGTSTLFRHAIPSPVEITRAAVLHIPHVRVPSARTLPNRGLFPNQMAYAVRHVGLEPHMVGLGDPYSIQSTAYAYLRGRVPLLLGFELGEVVDGEWRCLGLHAVAITGYSLGNSAPSAYEGVLFAATRIDKLYAHDDQIGPFARMQLQPDGTLVTEWKSKVVPGTKLVARPHFFLVPLYNKIRITNQTIEAITLQLDALLEAARGAGISALNEQVEWDVSLTTVNAIKEEWFDTLTDVAQRSHVLPLHLPKFIWRVTAKVAGTSQLDLLFDATDVDQGRLFVAGLDRGGAVAPTLQGLASAVGVSPHVRAVLERAHAF